MHFSTEPLEFPVTPSDQFMEFNRATDDGQIRLVLTFDGHVEADRMARAVQLTLAYEPVLGCRYVERWWRSHWEWRESAGTVFDQTSGSDNGPDELVRFLSEPARPDRAPQLRVRLFRGRRDVLGITISHLVTDGRGAIDYAGCLARIYRALEADRAFHPHPDLCRGRHPAQVLHHVSRSELARALRQRPVPRRLASWGLPPIERGLAPVFLTRPIESEQLGAVFRCARALGTSVTEVFLTAYFRSLFEFLDPPAGVALPVAVPVDLRRYLPYGSGGRLANLTGVVLPAVSREPGAAFHETLNQVHRAMQAARRGRPELAQVVYGSLALLPGVAVMRRLVRRFQVACPSFAAFGVVDPDTFDFGDGATVGDLGMFGPVQYPPAFGLGVYTFRDRATVATGTPAKAIAEQVLDRFLHELPA